MALPRLAYGFVLGGESGVLGMRILLVENDACARSWLAEQALELGVTLFMADDERSALGIVTRVLVDAVVIDVASCMRPRSMYWHRLRRQLRVLDVPLLTYSSIRRLEGEAARLGWRCSGFLPRPFHMGKVLWHVLIAQRKAAALSVDEEREDMLLSASMLLGSPPAAVEPRV